MIALLQTTAATLGPASDAVICAGTLGLYAVLWGLADWWGRR